MTLEYQIFDEKAREWARLFYWIFGRQNIFMPFMEACMEAAIELPALCLKSVTC